MLTYLPGETIGDRDPWPGWALADSMLAQVGQWLRRVHDLTEAALQPPNAFLTLTVPVAEQAKPRRIEVAHRSDRPRRPPGDHGRDRQDRILLYALIRSGTRV